MFYVYCLKSIRYNEWYTGHTNDIARRLHEHNAGENTSTAKYKPWKLVYYEACLNKDDAIRREQYLKTSQGRRMLKLRLRSYIHEHTSAQNENI